MRTNVPLVLAIDQGTGSTKALLVDAEGTVVARGSSPLGQSHPRPGWVEQPPDELWASVRRAVRDCVPDELAPRVVAVGISNQRESLVLWDRRSGEAVGPLLGWQDRRTAAACAELAATGAGDLVRAVSGLPLDPMFSALKAQWLLDAHDPERTGRYCLGTVDSWLLSRLGGPHRTETGNAARTQLMDVATGQWDERLLELFRVPRAALPEIVGSTGPFPAVRDLAPLPDGVPVLAVLGDSHAALFAHGGWRPGVVKATYGTGSSIMAVGDGSADGLCRTVAWEIDDIGKIALALEGNILATGQTLVWLAELLGTTPDVLLAEAATTSSDGVHLVPAFGGLGAPWWNPDATTVACGMTLGTRRAQLAAAAVESVAFQVADVVSAIEAAAGQVDVLVCDGGLSRNDHLMQLQADISGRRVARSSEADLSALGAAHLAGLRAGLWSWPDLENQPRAADEFHPRGSDAERSARREAWLGAVERSTR
jgi:glycerol kinase